MHERHVERASLFPQLDPQFDSQKTGEAAVNGAAPAGAEEKPGQAPPKAGAAAASTKLDRAPEQAAPLAAAEKEQEIPVKPSATPKKVYIPPWARTPPASAQRAAEAAANAAAKVPKQTPAAATTNTAPAPVETANQAVPAAAAALSNGTQASICMISGADSCVLIHSDIWQSVTG